MFTAIPSTARQLHHHLASRLAVAALSIGLLAGITAYGLERWQIESEAFDKVANSARHFAPSALDRLGERLPVQQHEEVGRLLDRAQYIGVRVFNPAGVLIYEAWSDFPAALRGAIQETTHLHAWPKITERHQNWVDVGEERLLQVVVPLASKNNSVAGYLEGVSRLDSQAAKAQRSRIWRGVLTAAIAVLLTAGLLYPLLLAMLRQTDALTNRLMNSNLSLMRSLGNAIAKRDSDTEAHNYRVTYYAVALGEALALPSPKISDLITGAFLHDIGKIGIPDDILLKPGKLTEDEFEIMKRHVNLGAEIVAGNPWLAGAAETIRYHHEKYDGTGYPSGLKANGIPLVARVFAVVDVFDALTSMRPYKPLIELEHTLLIIATNAGKHFDPDVVDVFLSIAPELHATYAHLEEKSLKDDLRPILSKYFQ